MTKKFELPYIREVYIDKNHHLIVENSNGEHYDNGYLPTDGITIYYKEDDKNERCETTTSDITDKD